MLPPSHFRKRAREKVGVAEIILPAIQGKKSSILGKCFPRQQFRNMPLVAHTENMYLFPLSVSA